MIIGKIKILAVLLLTISGLHFNSTLEAEDIDGYFDVWKKLESGGKFEEAIPVFKKAIETYPKEAWFQVFVGYSLVRLGRFEEGFPYLEKAVTLAPGNAMIAGNLGFGYGSYADHLAFNLGKWDDAVTYYKKAIDRIPENAHYHVLYGNALRFTKNHTDALTAFTRAIKLGAGDDPNNFENIRAGVREGASHFLNEMNYDDAAAFAKLGNTLFPDDAEIRKLFIFAHLLGGDADTAREAIERISDEPEKRVYEGAILFFSDGEKDADALFHNADLDRRSDHFIDELISSVYEFKVAGLPYEERMASKYQTKIVEYETAAVRKYFKLHPYTQAKRFIPPVRAEFIVYQGEGGRSFHYGLRGHFSYDIGRFAEESFGMPIVAVADGTVIAAVDHFEDNPENTPVKIGASANSITIRHGDVMSVYVHIKKESATVLAGQNVRAGQIIAEIGNSGMSTGPHLHFSVQKENGTTLPVHFTRLLGRTMSSPKYSAMTTLHEGYVYMTK